MNGPVSRSHRAMVRLSGCLHGHEKHSRCSCVARQIAAWMVAAIGPSRRDRRAFSIVDQASHDGLGQHGLLPDEQVSILVSCDQTHT